LVDRLKAKEIKMAKTARYEIKVKHGRKIVEHIMLDSYVEAMDMLTEIENRVEVQRRDYLVEFRDTQPFGGRN
jgi:ribosomal protein L22